MCPREINASLGGGGRPAGSGEGQSAASGAAGACAGARKTGAAVQAKGVEAFWGKEEGPFKDDLSEHSHGTRKRECPSKDDIPSNEMIVWGFLSLSSQ